MATFSKPTGPFNWATDTPGTSRVDPGVAKRGAGWVSPEKPPDTFFNQLFGESGDFLSWIDERMQDGANNDEFELLKPGGGRFLFYDGVFENFYLVDTVTTSPWMSYISSTTTATLIADVSVTGVTTLNDDLVALQGIAVGYVGAPDPSQVRVGDDDFYMSGSASAPFITFDSGDSILFNRAANEFRFVIGGLRHVFDSTSIKPVNTAALISLGGVGQVYDESYVDKGFVFNTAAAGPISGNIGTHTIRNTVTSAGSGLAAGGIDGSQDTWNVSSINRVSTGIYDVTFSTALNTAPTVVVTLKSATQVFNLLNITASSFRVDIRNAATTAVQDGDFSFVTVGGA